MGKRKIFLLPHFGRQKKETLG
uniref:Syntaxin-8 isoform x3 n=1 Tax=Triatoma infestans TaxID=30076 RepID=A0A170UWA9_TRIIF